MREIYIPNIFRTANIRVVEGEQKLSEIPYVLDFNLEDDQQCQAMLQFQLATLIENILLFDRVYLDIINFPVAIDMLYKIDPKNTEKMIKRGYISFLNCDEVVISTVKKSDGNFVIAFSGNKAIKINCVNDFEQILFGDFCYKKEIYKYLENMLLISKTYTGNIFEIGKQIVHMVDDEIKAKTYSKIGIGINGNYGITSKNKGIFDTICQVIRDETIAKVFDIDTIYHDDIVRNIAEMRVNRYYSTNDGFHKLIYVNDIPDIHKLFLEGNLTIEDIIKLKETRKYKSFQNWFFNRNNNDDIVKSFITEITRKSKLDSIPVKAVRFMSTTVIGAVNPVAGVIEGLADTFGIDLLKGVTPNMFFDDFSQKINKNERKGSLDYEEISVSLNQTIEIDLSKQNNLDQEQKVYDALVDYAQKIIMADDEVKAISYFDKSRKIFETRQTIKTLHGYLLCVINLSQRSIEKCRIFLMNFYDILYSSGDSISGNEEVIVEVREAYLFLCVFGLIIRIDSLFGENILYDKIKELNKNGYLDNILKETSDSLREFNEELIINSSDRTVSCKYEIILERISKILQDNIYVQQSYAQLLSKKLFLANEKEVKNDCIEKMRDIYTKNSKNILILCEYAKCLVNMTSIAKTYEEKYIWTNRLRNLYTEYYQNENVQIYNAEALVNLSYSDNSDETINELMILSNEHNKNIVLKILCSIAWFNRTTKDCPLLEKERVLKEIKRIYVNNPKIKEVALYYASALVNLQGSYNDKITNKRVCDEVYSVLGNFEKNDLRSMLIKCKAVINYLNFCNNYDEIEQYYLRLLKNHLQLPNNEEIIHECVCGIFNSTGNILMEKESIERLKKILLFSFKTTENKTIIKRYSQYMQTLISRTELSTELKNRCINHLIVISKEYNDVVATEVDSTSKPQVIRFIIL
ncbi:hypothetical protein [Clostridium sp. UBA3061]|uniref:hypothetical protein n=1 Tax=Clostridium sp. UBA3061 TaxID=1946353 RepID=UPI0032174C2C